MRVHFNVKRAHTVRQARMTIRACLFLVRPAWAITWW